MAAKHYVTGTHRKGWKVAGSRVSLDSIVCAFLDGLSPESIADDFPALSLERVYGAIAFYLENRGRVDKYLEAHDRKWDELRRQSEAKNDSLLKRLRAQRKKSRGELAD